MMVLKQFKPKPLLVIGAFLAVFGATVASATSESGVTVLTVQPGSPAAMAGIARGDIILQAGGTAVDTEAALASVLNGDKSGDTLSLQLNHSDAVESVNVTLGAGVGGGGWLGVTVLGGMNGMKLPSTGAYVASVDMGSPAEMAGLVPGDVILSANGTTLDADHQLADLLNARSWDDVVSLSVLKPGQTDAKDMRIALTRKSMMNNSPWLGLNVIAAGSEQGMTAMTPPSAGALVTGVDQGSPAELVGLVPGDIILSADGVTLDSTHQLDNLINAKSTDDLVALMVQEPGQTQATEMRFTLARKSTMDNTPWLGLDLVTAGEGQATVAALPPANGEYVVDVAANSPAESAGIVPGDVILSVDGTSLDANHQLADMIDSKASDDVVSLAVQEPGQTQASDLTIALSRKSDKDAMPWLGVESTSASSEQTITL